MSANEEHLLSVQFARNEYQMLRNSLEEVLMAAGDNITPLAAALGTDLNPTDEGAAAQQCGKDLADSVHGPIVFVLNVCETLIEMLLAYEENLT